MSATMIGIIVSASVSIIIFGATQTWVTIRKTKEQNKRQTHEIRLKSLEQAHELELKVIEEDNKFRLYVIKANQSDLKDYYQEYLDSKNTFFLQMRQHLEAFDNKKISKEAYLRIIEKEKKIFQKKHDDFANLRKEFYEQNKKEINIIRNNNKYLFDKVQERKNNE